MEEGAFLEEARALQALCRERHVPFIVNDNVDIARAMGADGVHVGQSDMEALDVRAKLGPDKIIGVSAHSVEEALLAEKHGADYLGVGAMFPTGSKADVQELPYDCLLYTSDAADDSSGGHRRHFSGECGQAGRQRHLRCGGHQRHLRRKEYQVRRRGAESRRRGYAAGMIRGAIFDLDGVLLDSMGIWRDLGARYLRARGISPAPGLGEVLFAMSMEQGAAYLKTHYSLPEGEVEIWDGIAALLADYYGYEVPAKPGAEELLQFFSRRGIPMAAATSSPRNHVERALTRLGLRPYLKTILTTTEIGESKHAPTIYHRAAVALGTVPAETLVFEDSLYAMQTAKAAGYRTVGVYDGQGEPNQAGLRQAAEVYLTELAAFPAYWPALNNCN